MSFCDEMLYAAFRAAFVATLDCMLRESLDRQQVLAKATGFLDVYPILQGTAPQIQLECLLQTWDRLQQGESSLTDFDHCVVHAAYETLAKMGELTTRPALSRVWKGPQNVVTASDHWLVSKVRTLQLTADEKLTDKKILLEAQLNDCPSVSGMFMEDKAESASYDVVSVVGRWKASALVIFGSKGLLTDDEQDILRIFFEEQAGLLR